MKIAILGSRGIPASYGGLETSIQETTVRFVQMGIDTTVYCRRNHYKDKISNYESVKLIYLPSIKTKHFDTITHTLLSVIHSIFKKFDIISIYGVGNSIFLPFYRLMGIPVIINVDGADWKRKKWGKFAQWFLKTSRFIAVRFSNYYIVDNELLASEYTNKYGKKAIYIPYGAQSDIHYNPEVLNKYELIANGYIIFVGRFVKEKGIDFLVKNFERTITDRKLVIVGGNALDKEYEQEIKRTKDGRIIFTGFLYGNDYESLLKCASFYVSCSFLEGTSPSLLSAMAINGFALVSDLEENLEVLKGTCATFKTGNSNDFRTKLNYYLNNPEVIEIERVKTKELFNKYYNWEKITKQYTDLFDKLKK